MLLTVHYHKDYPSTCYPKFSVYAEWLSEKEIDEVQGMIDRFREEGAK